jgi:hypothetical protein
MTSDILSLVPCPQHLQPEAIEYLRKAIRREVVEGVSSFIEKQSQLFNQHAPFLAEVLRAIDHAPEGIYLNRFSDGFQAWLRENGVSSSRITQLKGYLRLRERAFQPDGRYSQEEKEFIRSLEVEKAYLFGRLTYEGQEKACVIRRQNGRLTLRDLRELVRTDAYDPSSVWREKYEGKRPSASNEGVDLTRPPHALSQDLATKLQAALSEFVSLKPYWEQDRRVLNLIDHSKVDIIHLAMKSVNDAYNLADGDLPF